MTLNFVLARICALLVFACDAALAAQPAGAVGMEISHSAEAWLHATVQRPNDQSALNPNNTFIRLPDAGLSTELRWQAQGRSDDLDFNVRLRGLVTKARGGAAGDAQTEAYLSQAYFRWKSDRLGITVGRQLLTWGPGSFRSPSNPYYFDAGRNQPLRELSGLDAVVATYQVAPQISAQAFFIAGSGHTRGSQGEDFSGSQTGATDFTGNRALKLEGRFNDFTMSAIASDQPRSSPFIGGYFSWAPDDAWMVHGEFGRGRRPNDLSTIGSGTGQAYLLQSPSRRATTAVLGASYTLESGQSVTAEVLYDGHGYRLAQEDAFFDVAQHAAVALTGPDAVVGAGQLAMGTRFAPVLLGRRYLAIVWQSGPQDSTFFWRAAWAANLQDHSNQLSLYAEKSVSKRASLYAAAALNQGGARSEFPLLLRNTVSFGVKYALF